MSAIGKLNFSPGQSNRFLKPEFCPMVYKKGLFQFILSISGKEFYLLDLKLANLNFKFKLFIQLVLFKDMLYYLSICLSSSGYAPIGL